MSLVSDQSDRIYGSRLPSDLKENRVSLKNPTRFTAYHTESLSFLV